MPQTLADIRAALESRGFVVGDFRHHMGSDKERADYARKTGRIWLWTEVTRDDALHGIDAVTPPQRISVYQAATPQNTSINEQNAAKIAREDLAKLMQGRTQEDTQAKAWLNALVDHVKSVEGIVAFDGVTKANYAERFAVVRVFETQPDGSTPLVSKLVRHVERGNPAYVITTTGNMI